MIFAYSSSTFSCACLSVHLNCSPGYLEYVLSNLHLCFFGLFSWYFTGAHHITWTPNDLDSLRQPLHDRIPIFFDEVVPDGILSFELQDWFGSRVSRMFSLSGSEFFQLFVWKISSDNKLCRSYMSSESISSVGVHGKTQTRVIDGILFFNRTFFDLRKCELCCLFIEQVGGLTTVLLFIHFLEFPYGFEI